MSTASHPDRRSALRQALRLCIIDGVASSPLCYLWLPGNFIVAALLTGLYGLPEAAYGLIASIPFWCNFLQIFITPALAHRFHSKHINLAAAWSNATVWLAMAVALAWMPRDNPRATTPLFVAFFFIFSLLASVNSVAWNAWTQEWSPERIRGKYFGRRNGMIQGVTMVFLLIVWGVFAHYKGSLLAMQAIIVGSVAFRVWAIVAQHRLHCGPASPAPILRLPWREQIQTVLRCRSLLMFIAFSSVWGFAYNSLGPFYPVFMYRQLGMSLSAVCLFIILNTISAAVTMPTWGKLLDRFGNKSVMAAAVLLWQAQYLVWMFLDRGNSWLLYGLWLWNGFTWAGFTLGLFNMLLKLIPPEAKAMAIGVNTAVTSFVTAVAPIISGAAITYAIHRGWDPMRVYHYAFVIQIAPAFLSCLILLRVEEPKARSLSEVFGAMRNIRTLDAMLGLTFIGNYVFVKPLRKNSR